MENICRCFAKYVNLKTREELNTPKRYKKKWNQKSAIVSIFILIV